MWPSDRPLPIGGMPCRSTNVMNAVSSRLMIANEWSVPRWSCHMSIGATGTACSVDGHDRRVLAAHRHRRDIGRVRRMRRGQLAHGVDELVPHRGGVLLGGSRTVRRYQWPLRGADRRRVVGDQDHLQVGGPDVYPDRPRHRRILTDRRAGGEMTGPKAGKVHLSGYDHGSHGPDGDHRDRGGPRVRGLRRELESERAAPERRFRRHRRDHPRATGRSAPPPRSRPRAEVADVGAGRVRRPGGRAQPDGRPDRRTTWPRSRTRICASS